MSKPYIDFETERLHIRSVSIEDKEPYMKLRTESSEISKAYVMLPGFMDYEWEQELNNENEIYLSVFMRDNGLFVASASIQGFRDDQIELGYDVVKDYRNQGIATEIICALIQEVHKTCMISKVFIKTDVNNTASRRVAEKCGGTLVRNEDSTVSKVLSKSYRNEGKEDFRLPSEEIKEVIERGA